MALHLKYLIESPYVLFNNYTEPTHQSCPNLAYQCYSGWKTLLSDFMLFILEHTLLLLRAKKCESK